MMTHPFKSFLLLAFLLSVSSSSAPEWTDANFEKNLDAHQKAFVMLYAPWCGHCKNLKPTWDQLADDKTISDQVAIVKVDCTESGKKTCEKYSVKGFPTIKLIFKESGKERVLDYEGGRTKSDLESYVKENILPPFQEVSESGIGDFIKSETNPAVIGFFKSESSALFKEFKAAAKDLVKSFKFGYTFSEDAATQYKQKQESVTIFRQPHLISRLDAEYVSTSDTGSLVSFLSSNKHGLVGFRTPSNQLDFESPMVVVFVGVNPFRQSSSFRLLYNRVIKVAKEFKTVKFAVSLHQDYSKFLDEFRERTDDNAIYVVGFDAKKQKFVSPFKSSVDKANLFLENLSDFTENFIKGDVYQPHIKSQPVPLPNDEPVKVVVASTFEEIVLDDDKDVLIEFYAPWCGHCKKLEPIYTELAELLKDEEHLTIAKMDATANEVHSDFSVSGFPTIYLAQANKKAQPLVFDGKRDVASMVKWLKKYTTFPVKYDGELPEPKEDL